MKPCPQCGHSCGSGVRDQSRLSLAVASNVTSSSAVSVEVSTGDGQEFCYFCIFENYDKQRDKGISDSNNIKIHMIQHIEKGPF